MHHTKGVRLVGFPRVAAKESGKHERADQAAKYKRAALHDGDFNPGQEGPKARYAGIGHASLARARTTTLSPRPYDVLATTLRPPDHVLSRALRLLWAQNAT